MARRIKFHWELDVFALARQGATEFFRLSKSIPKEETYSLTDQGRRASRSVGAQIAEAWHRRKYEAVFINKLSEAEGEAAETQVWVMHAVDCGYLTSEEGRSFHQLYDRLIGKLVTMGNNPAPWLLTKTSLKPK